MQHIVNNDNVNSKNLYNIYDMNYYIYLSLYINKYVRLASKN